MLHYYFLTPLEQRVEQLYRRIGIQSPEQLNVAELADRLDIRVYYADINSLAVERKGLYSICLNRRLSPAEQWEDFLHELCHLLLHCGNQMMLPEDFVDLQEEQAGHFQLYAAVPFYMLKAIDLPVTKEKLALFLMQEFRITYRLACRRADQIYRRIEGGWDRKSSPPVWGWIAGEARERYGGNRQEE